ncbi:putative phosphatase [Rubrobacter xylanophilus DSM 9941]|nr:putative phosphatase [Rubrobacter xylanophilus DSM 9941]
MAGNRTSHGAEDNLYKITRLLEHDPDHTFGMDKLLAGVSFEEGYSAVREHTGHPPDHEETPGRGCIDPERTAGGLLAAGAAIREVAAEGGRIIFGTGHPGALILYYLELSRWAAGLGADVITARTQGRYERGSRTEWVERVAALGDGASLHHTHDPEPMREVLEAAGEVDLVVADHGFAGAAVAAGVRTIAIMDTNDPALAVVSSRQEANLTVIPMDDNRPPNSYLAALEAVRAAGAHPHRR